MNPKAVSSDRMNSEVLSAETSSEGRGSGHVDLGLGLVYALYDA